MQVGHIARVLAVALVMGGIAVPASAQTGLMPGPEPLRTATPIVPMAHTGGVGFVAPSNLIGIEPALARTLPNAPPYAALSGQQKFHIFLRQAYSPFTFVTTAFDAGLAQLSDDWPAYGQGMEGYGKRYGAMLANHEAASFFQRFLLPAVFHQDPRYFRRGSQEPFLPRVGYSASRVFITRADNGHATFNTSLVLGLLLVASVTNSYYPRPQRGLEETMSRFGGGLISNAQDNLLREFWPDFTRLFHRHEPEELKIIEKLAKQVPFSGKLGSRPDSTVVQPTAPADSLNSGQFSGAPGSLGRK
jgi:hypothetical protein